MEIVTETAKVRDYQILATRGRGTWLLARESSDPAADARMLTPNGLSAVGAADALWALGYWRAYDGPQDALADDISSEIFLGAEAVPFEAATSTALAAKWGW
jgi:hypothetical protein